MSIYETAVKVNELYQDYDPFNFEEEMCPAEEIAKLIAAKDFRLPQELMEMAVECDDYDELKEEILDVLNEVMKHYS